MPDDAVKWDPPCWAWVGSKCGIKRTVWVRHVTACGRYASVSYARNAVRHHAVLVSDLRRPEERHGQDGAKGD